MALHFYFFYTGSTMAILIPGTYKLQKGFVFYLFPGSIQEWLNQRMLFVISRMNFADEKRYFLL
jgi:hypothetical protein